jgi:hypothetical protein
VRGTALIEELSSASGLPDDMIGEELRKIVVNAGKSASEVTLDDLRVLLASYLQDVLVDAKRAFEQNPPCIATLSEPSVCRLPAPKGRPKLKRVK